MRATPSVRLGLCFICLSLAGAGCAQGNGFEELFAMTGVAVDVREGVQPEAVSTEDGAPGSSDKVGAIVVRPDGTADEIGIAGCATAGEAAQTVYFTQGTTFLPQQVLQDPRFPATLKDQRVGADGVVHKDGDRCTLVADRLRVSQDDASASPTPGPATGAPTATPSTPTSTATDQP
jgi:hypothetical protein